MKRRKPNLKNEITLTLLTLFGFSCYSQIPEDYITKVSYHEKKEVKYSLPSEAVLDCLTLSELSQYHGYRQLYKIDAYVDFEGDVLKDKHMIEEYQVRDDWMKGFSRITVGKNTLDVYDSEGQLFYQKPRDVDTNTVFLTPQQAESYGFFDLNLAYYNQLVSGFSANGFEVSEHNHLLTASSPYTMISYDHNSKVVSNTEYDSSGLKTRESVIQYGLTQEEDTYFPETETIIEWFMGKNGCCIRKTTIIKRYEYQREVVEGSSPVRTEPKEDQFLDTDAKSDFEISMEKNRNVFRIESRRILNRKLNVVVYDMAGKIVLQKKVKIGEPIQMPSTSRTGIYLVHIRSNKKGHPVTGKIIMSGNGQQF